VNPGSDFSLERLRRPGGDYVSNLKFDLSHIIHVSMSKYCGKGMLDL
jgi:hypothetical protein